MRDAEILEADTDEEFARKGAGLITQWMADAIAKRGHATIALCGGRTCGDLYLALGMEKEIDWSKVTLLLTDDRFVPPDHPKSNQFLIHSTLLKNAPVPSSQILFPQTTLPLEECLREYDRVLASHLRTHTLDIVILGMGEDGHIASLFPPLATEAYGPTSVVHTMTDRFDIHDRLSLTLPVLTKAAHALLLLKGSEKKRVWEEMTASPEGSDRWPMKAVMEKVETTVLVGH